MYLYCYYYYGYGGMEEKAGRGRDDVGEVDEVIIFGDVEPMSEASRWRRKPR